MVEKLPTSTGEFTGFQNHQQYDLDLDLPPTQDPGGHQKTGKGDNRNYDSMICMGKKFQETHHTASRSECFFFVGKKTLYLVT